MPSRQRHGVKLLKIALRKRACGSDRGPYFESTPGSKFSNRYRGNNQAVNQRRVGNERVGELGPNCRLAALGSVNSRVRESDGTVANCGHNSRYVTPFVARRSRTKIARGGLPRALISPKATLFERWLIAKVGLAGDVAG